MRVSLLALDSTEFDYATCGFCHDTDWVMNTTEAFSAYLVTVSKKAEIPV